MPDMPNMDQFEWLLRLEDSTLKGEIVNLGDGAGLTRFGITSRNWSHAVPPEFWTDMPTSTAIIVAKSFYHAHYWNPLSLDTVPMPYAASILSCAVNLGTGQAIALMAQAQGSMSSFLKLWRKFYHDRVLKYPADARFLDGWLARANCQYPALLK